MSRPIVHIGYHKTGTSWFQKNFYPRVRNAGYLGRQAVRDAFLNTTAFAFDPDKAAEVLSAETDGRPIICEEDLSGHYYNGGCLESLSKDIAYRIHAVYPQAQIVIFIRNQLDMIRSTYLQYIRSGGTRSPRRFLAPYERSGPYRKRWYLNPRLTLDHFAYQHLIRHYRSIFGSQNVHVFCYEAFASDIHGFVESFARHFELDVPLEQLHYARRNESLKTVSAQLARLTGPFSRWEMPDRLVVLPVIPRWMHKAGLKAFNKTPLGGRPLSNRQLFGSRLYQELHDHFVADNRRLGDECGLPLTEYGYPTSPYTSGDQAVR